MGTKLFLTAVLADSCGLHRSMLHAEGTALLFEFKWLL